MAKQPMARRRSMYAEKATPVKTVETPPCSAGCEVEPTKKSLLDTKAGVRSAEKEHLVSDSEKPPLIKPEWPGSLKRLGVTVKAFGELWGVPHHTIKDWSRGADPTPGWVDRAVMLMADPEVMKRLRDGGKDASN